MKKVFLSALLIGSALVSLSFAQEKGGIAPCLATCFLGDSRIGYYMNEGKSIETDDWIVFAGDLFAGVGKLYGGFKAYEVSQTSTGFLSGCIWGIRAGSEINTYKIRTMEVMMCIPVVNLIPAIGVPLDAFSGRTWSEVVEEEGLKR